MIQLKALHKSFDQHKAVNGLDISICLGDFYGLLGPNGAGKSTTISMICGLMAPDSGEILIKGEKRHLGSKSHLGVIPQDIALYAELSAMDNLLFWGGLYGIGKKVAKERATHWLDRMGLGDRKNEKVAHYSGGMKRRVNMAAALMHEPDILLMDEPSVGIDPHSRHLIYEVMTEIHRSGKTILYTTHYMEEAERFCNRIGIMDQGKIIAEGSLSELRKNSAMPEYIRFTLQNPRTEMQERIRKEFPSLIIEEKGWKIPSKQYTTEAFALLNLCREQQWQIDHMELHQGNLEELFLHLTGKNLRDE